MTNKILSSSPEVCDALRVTRRSIRCDECGSEHAAVCSVELRFLCMNHFVSHCYQRLGEYENALRGSHSPESARRFLQECAAQVAKLLLTGHELQNIDRARLFDIMLWANELFHRSISKLQNGCERAASGCR